MQFRYKDIYSRQMNYILSFFAKLIGYLLLLAFIYEIGMANYTDITLSDNEPTFSTIFNTTAITVQDTVKNIVELKLMNLKSINMATWIFCHRFYFIVLILVIFVLYYKFQISLLVEPKLLKTPKKTLSQYEIDKRQETRVKLNELYPKVSTFYDCGGKEARRLSSDEEQTIVQIKDRQYDLFPSE